jgi:hypothetical protein
MKYCLFLVQWMVLATAVAAPANAPKKPAPSGNRFLFVVETSAAMNRLEHGGRQAVFDLIYSGFEGRMRKGDTYGIWTFNQNVYAGVYPMQVWDGQRNLEHASAVGRFLKGQKYEKEPNLTNVIKYLQVVVRTVKDVNVFLVTDGAGAIVGTPFDETINASYRTNRVQVREAKRPLVTTLTARNGQFTGAYVSLAGEKILLADLPPSTNAAPRMEGPLTSTNGPSKTAAGQIVAVVNVETNTGVTNLAAATSQTPSPALTSAEPITTNAAPVKRVVIIKKEVVKTNAIEESTTGVTAVAADPPTSLVNPMATNNTPPAVASTNEVAPPRPEPLSSVVPAQVTVSARTLNASPKIVKSASPSPLANALLMIGGMFVGMSVIGAVLFVRRVRTIKEPSFISQGMEKR